MPRKPKNHKVFTASVAINLLILYAFTVWAVAAITKSYANSPVSTSVNLTGVQPVPSGKVSGTAAPAGSTLAQSGTVVGGGKEVHGVPQQIKNAAKQAAERVYESRKEIIAAQGVSKGLFLSTAYTDLLAMSFREAGHDCTRKGDYKNGQPRSFGCWQIQTKLHGVTVAQAEDPFFAAEWTLDRMVRDTDYPRKRSASIAKHNGSGPSAVAYANAVKQTAAEYAKQGL